MTALQRELLDALRSEEGRALLREAFSAAAGDVLTALPNGKDDELLTVEEVAQLTGHSKAAIFKRIQREGLPVVRSGRSVRIRRRDLDALQH